MILRADDLVKKYKQRAVVNHVSFNVSQGEIVGLLGPNGAGKTTSFYMIVGLIKPNEGRIFLEEIKSGKPFDICYHIEENIWRDRRSIQLNVKGIRF